MSRTSSGGSNNPESTKGILAFGITRFAGVLLTLVSIFQILQGIAAIADDKVFVRTPNYSFEFDVTTWGWVQLILGLVGLCAGIGILMGQTWGRIVGILIVGLAAVSNFMFMPHYPFWSLTLIALDVVVIWALCTQIAEDRA